MATEFDKTDFVDGDYQTGRKGGSAADSIHGQTPAGAVAGRAPTREELDARVGETQQRLADLKRAQENLERERSALEEARRRRVELQTGRDEMITHLTRGLGLIEEAEFAARRDAEQMARTLEGFRDALSKVRSIREETWTQDNWNMELTRALTTIENARMEWNTARLKWPVLNGGPESPVNSSGARTVSPPAGLEHLPLGQLCKLGLALTWPLAVAALAALMIFVVLLLRR